MHECGLIRFLTPVGGHSSLCPGFKVVVVGGKVVGANVVTGGIVGGGTVGADVVIGGTVGTVVGANSQS